MNKEQSVQDMTDTMAKFTSYIGKRLPNDVKDKLAELRTFETNPLAKAVYTSMAENQEAADKLDRPSCQDTGVIQYFIKAGARFPLLGELEEILRHATEGATRMGPLRHNAVETFDEKNTGTIGIAPSANLNPERNFPSLFEPVHGSAPDICGKGIANPIGQIWCGAMMLEHLGHADAANTVMRAIELVLAEGPRTPDMGGKATTSDVGKSVAAVVTTI